MLLVKVGGGKKINWNSLCQDIASLMNKEQIILVHGASAQRDEMASRLSIPIRTVVSPSGVTSVYTDQETLDLSLMVYAGLVNKQIVARMHKYGINALGLSGIDGKLWKAKPKREILVKKGNKVMLFKGNLTGRVEEINTNLINILLENSYLPVICPPAISFGNDIVNSDSDWGIAVMAEAFNIHKMVVLFEAPGLLKNPEDENSLIRRINKSEIDDYLKYARDRMKKKIFGAKRAIEGGVKVIYWGDSRVESPLKSAMEGKGTIIC